MAYSQSPVTLARMLPFLGPLTEGNTTRWTNDGPEFVGNQLWSRWWSYKVREALFIARLIAEGRAPQGEIPPGVAQALAAAAERFKIEEVSTRLVQAVPAHNTSEAQVLVGTAPTHGLDEAGTVSSMRVGSQTIESVQEAWRAAQPSNAPLFFPEAGLEELELEQLHTWALERGLILIVSGSALTLTRPSRDTKALAWAPGTAPEDERVADEAFPFS